jgi:hypothetical protein
MARGGSLNNLEMVLAAFKLKVLKGEEPGLWYCQQVRQNESVPDFKTASQLVLAIFKNSI